MYLEGEEEHKAHAQTHKLLTCEDCSETFTRRQQYLVHMAVSFVPACETSVCTVT